MIGIEARGFTPPLGQQEFIIMPDIAFQESSAIAQIPSVGETAKRYVEAQHLFQESQPLDVVMDPQVMEQYIVVTDIKDADVAVQNGQKNIYASIGTVRGVPGVAQHETWQVGRMAQREDGAYELMPPVNFIGGNLIRPCAPAMSSDNFGGDRMLMAVHQDCFTSGNDVEMFESRDGQNFNFIGNILEAEEGIGKYDPEISEIDGRKILTYVRYDEDVPQRTEIHAAEIVMNEDGSYSSIDLGAVIKPEDIETHNEPGEGFEWGIEAAKLHKINLGRGQEAIAATFVSFQRPYDQQGNLRERETRQRFTIALFDKIGEKPYWVGYLAQPQGVGENGHGFWDGNEAVYQERMAGGNWGLRVVQLNPDMLYGASSASLGLAA
jgi:hypothetical protein